MSNKPLEQDQAGDLRRIVEKKRQVLRQNTISAMTSGQKWRISAMSGWKR